MSVRQTRMAGQKDEPDVIPLTKRRRRLIWLVLYIVGNLALDLVMAAWIYFDLPLPW